MFLSVIYYYDSHALSIDKGYRQNKIKDLALIYQGGVHRIDWTSDQFLPMCTSVCRWT